MSILTHSKFDACRTDHMARVNQARFNTRSDCKSFLIFHWTNQVFQRAYITFFEYRLDSRIDRRPGSTRSAASGSAPPTTTCCAR